MHGRENIGTISYCTLLTNDKADEIVKGWDTSRRKNALRKELSEAIKTADLEMLEAVQWMLTVKRTKFRGYLNVSILPLMTYIRRYNEQDKKKN